MSVPVVGITGSISLPSGFNILVKSGTLGIKLTEVDTTNTSSNGFYEGTTSIRSGSGTAVGIAQSGGAGTAPGFANIPTGNNVQVAASGSFNVVGSSCKYTGSIIITNIKLGFNYQGSNALSFDWRFTGSFTEVWA
jgi:hypothetical protein